MNAKSTATKTTRKPAAKPITPAPVVSGALKDLEKQTPVVASGAPAEEKAMAVSTQTLISAISNAVVSYKYALQIEMATGLCLFAEYDGISRDSKQKLQEIYVAAGYDAKDQFKAEYKTVRRRIDAAAELFNWIGEDKIAELIENRAEMAAINALVQYLEQYNLRGINSVFALVGKPVKQVRQAPVEMPVTQQEAEKPSEAPAPSVAQAVADQIAKDRQERAEKEDTSILKRFSSEHVSVSVAQGTTREELMQIAMELLEFANTIPAVKKEMAKAA
jgi:hypothetical protein